MNYNLQIKKIDYLAWLILLFIIFLRPFISSRACPFLELYYNIALTLTGFIFLIAGKREIHFKLQDLPILLFLISIVISSLFSIKPLSSLVASIEFIIFIFVFILTRTLNDYEKKQLIFTIIAASIIISLYAIYQYLFVFRHIFDYLAKYKVDYPYAQEFLARKRVFATFFSPDMLAGYLILIIPLVLGYYFKQKNKSLVTGYPECSYSSKYLFGIPKYNFLGHYIRGWLLVTLVILSISLFLTKSLGAILSLFLGLFIFSYFFKQSRKKLIFPLLILALFCLLVVFLRGPQIFNITNPHNPFIRRLLYWKQSLKVIKQHPFLGIGLGNYQIPESIFAHNTYLQLWAELGILGLGSLIWFVFNYLKAGLKQTKESFSKNYFWMGIFVSIIVFLIHNIIDFSFFILEVALIWWVLLALI